MPERPRLTEPPPDRAGGENAPRLGTRERQLIMSYAEAVGDTDKVIGLINRLCEQGYELQTARWIPL